MLHLFGRNPAGILELPVSEEGWNALLTGRLLTIPGGLYDFFFGKVPRPLCMTLETALQINCIQSIGFSRGGEISGIASIILLKNESVKGKEEAIELLARQAFLALHRKQSEDRMLAAKAEAAACFKSGFIAAVSHEIRTPLTWIIGGIDLLLLTETEEKKREQLDLVRRTAASLVEILSDVLDLLKN